MVTPAKSNEQAFEWLIEQALVGNTKEEREHNKEIADFDKQNPDNEKFYWGRPADLNKELAIDTVRLWSFLNATQSEKLKEYKGKDLEKSLPRQIAKIISTKGILEVLRKGVDLDNLEDIKLFYPKPSEADSEESKRLYAQNQFCVSRQQTFSSTNPGQEIDMVISVNGLPLFTMELKNPWTGQTARYNGIKQYKEERNPKEPLLNYGRCLAHFTMDKDEVYFTTRLNEGKTFFMPFNQGLPDGLGAGNPVNKNGYKTSYMWERILTKDTLSDIIMNYALFDYGETKTKKKVPHILRNAKKLIFPRFHQLDVVDKLIADVQEKGVGKRYLIEHSAGSGKSNSLTWLAFKLIKACALSESTVRSRGLGQQLFNTVIVVTDRRILDKQITENIKAFGQSDKIIAHADSSNELKTAIEGGKRIVITTIQKFPFICESITDVSDHNFAIIIDEAHSSQSGIAADKMNATVQRDPDQDGSDTDELIAKLIRDRKMSSNCSYFAFTATPKRETLECFGWQDEEGQFHPFHLYSMKQAIEEGFILDVLVNYTTYKSYYELVKSIEENPQYDEKKAQKLLRRTVERHPDTIAVKADTMLQHFDSKVFRQRKLKGKAKAMVVTKDIECAIHYYKALADLIVKLKLPYKVLIAFSGEKEVGGVTYTEAGLNGFAETETAERFEADENRILVVANKYLTGFDQPKLCAMYIDKPLAGVLAVQSLSRLNRAAPDLSKRSEDLFILDFYNKKDDMEESFSPFYTSTTLSEPTDVNILHELRSTLLSIGVFDEEDVNQFMEIYMSGAEPDKWAPIIDAAAHRFNHEIEFDDNGKADFKIKCKQFAKVYSRVAAIMNYEVLNWEKMFWFLRFLIPNLHVDVPGRDDLKDLLDSVDLNTYGLRRTGLNEKIELDSSETVLDPTKAAMAGAGTSDDAKEELDVILQEFNDKWFKGWDTTPEEQKVKLTAIVNAVKQDNDYLTLIVGNPDKQAAEEALDKIIDRIVRKQRQKDMSLYKEYMNEDFKINFRSLVTRMIEAPSLVTIK